MSTARRTLIVLGVSLPLLAACSNSGSSTAGSTVESVAQQASSAVASASAEVAATTTAAAGATTAAATNDPVGPAVEAFLKQHPDALIEEIDREDRGNTVEIDIVENDRIVSYRVTESGEITQNEIDNDRNDDDIAEAKSATVSAVDAFKQALSQHPDGIIDSVSLDDDDDGGTLKWDVEIDDKNYNDLAEVHIPAK